MTLRSGLSLRLMQGRSSELKEEDPGVVTLLKCPFCGGDAVECWSKNPCRDSAANSWLPGSAEAHVKCRECGSRGRSVYINCGTRDGTDEDVAKAMESARNFWNTRESQGKRHMKPKFTDLEMRALQAAQKSSAGNGDDLGFSEDIVAFLPDLTPQQVGGLISSLVKKGVFEDPRTRLTLRSRSTGWIAAISLCWH